MFNQQNTADKIIHFDAFELPFSGYMSILQIVHVHQAGISLKIGICTHYWSDHRPAVSKAMLPLPNRNVSERGCSNDGTWQHYIGFLTLSTNRVQSISVQRTPEERWTVFHKAVLLHLQLPYKM